MRARPTPRPRATTIEALREEIRRIEARTSARGYGASSVMMDSSDAHAGDVRAHASSSAAGDAAGWTLGDGKAHTAWDLPALDVAGVHEIKPALAGVSRGSPSDPMSDDRLAGGSWAANTSAALGFMLALVARRLARVPAPQTQAHTGAIADVVLCGSQRLSGELGWLNPHGLAAFGIDHRRLLLVSARRAGDVLAAVEECLRSGAPTLVMASVPDLDLTASRRLALAAAGGATPLVVMTDAKAPPAAATATRWTIASAPCGDHPLVPTRPGARRFHVRLERCRRRPVALQAKPCVLEWCDATLRFRLVAAFQDRALEASSGEGPPTIIGWPASATGRAA